MLVVWLWQVKSWEDESKDHFSVFAQTFKPNLLKDLKETKKALAFVTAEKFLKGVGHAFFPR